MDEPKSCLISSPVALTLNDFENPRSFSAVDISVIIHATEDDNKILQSLSDLICVHPSTFRRTISIGHWGNKILLVCGRLDGAVAQRLLQKIWNSLSAVDKDRAGKSQNSLIDERGNLYVRLDKQRLCQKRVSLSESDSVRFRFRPTGRFKISKKSNISER